MLIKEVRSLLFQELLVEWRLRYAINGIALYLVSVIFICYLSFKSQMSALSPVTWNTLFWIIILFAAVNAVTKSFIQISQGRLLYLYTMASPTSIIISKVIYNSLVLIGIGFAGFLFYSIVLGNPVADTRLYLVTIMLASIGFSSILTMTSGIASKAANSSALMAILSFPVLLPLLLIVIRVTKRAMEGLDWSVSRPDLIFLIAINIIVLVMTYLLFPFLWKS